MDEGYGRLTRHAFRSYVCSRDIKKTNCNHDPKFFTFVEGHIPDSPTTRGEVITFSSCCLVPRIRNSVLSGLIFLSASNSVDHECRIV